MKAPSLTVSRLELVKKHGMEELGFTQETLTKVRKLEKANSNSMALGMKVILLTAICTVLVSTSLEIQAEYFKVSLLTIKSKEMVY